MSFFREPSSFAQFKKMQPLPPSLPTFPSIVGKAKQRLQNPTPHKGLELVNQVLLETRIKVKLKTGLLTKVEKTEGLFIVKGKTDYLWIRRNQGH